tara:strand:- start:1772 stop:2038 length:267 start_codon:yes stop_codon:yes gene_type:complete
MRKVKTLIATGIAFAGLASVSMAFALTDTSRTGQSEAMMQSMAIHEQSNSNAMQHESMMHKNGMMPQMREMMKKCRHMMMQDKMEEGC